MLTLPECEGDFNLEVNNKEDLNKSQANKKPQLLIIDDQPIIVQLIHDLFQAEADVFMATSGEAGLALCKRIVPDIILLDVVMHGLSGFDVCQKLKADPALTHIPVIFITGHFDEQDEVAGFKLGAVDFIHKPINPIITKARVTTHLKHKQQTDLIRQMALVDALTGIANRRRFDYDFNNLWRQCLRDKLPLTLAILDVDYFKQYNDFYGHKQGDRALRQLGQSLRNTVGRPQDLVARIGGEEFALLLPNTPITNASVVLGRAMAQVRDLAIEHSQSPLGRLSISIGCAGVIPHRAAFRGELYEQADTALYAAKESGRDQLQFYRPPECAHTPEHSSAGN